MDTVPTGTGHPTATALSAAGDPHDPGALIQRAALALSLGDYAVALKAYSALAVLRPELPGVRTGLGMALAGIGRLHDALDCFDQAVRMAPRDAGARADQGLALTGLRRYAEAQDALQAALALDPGHVHALDSLGTVLQETGHLEDALASHEAALARSPDYAPAHLNRDGVLQALGRFEQALEANDRALALAPDHPVVHHSRATALQALGRYGEALESYGAAISLSPGDAVALGNRAVLRDQMGDHAGALADFGAALAIAPSDPELRFNASLCRLRSGDFPAGWRDFESRWQIGAMRPEVRDLGGPRWRGEANAAVLLHAEQGFGDTLQFCRYAKLVADRGNRVTLEVEPSLVRLMRRLDPRVTVTARGEALPPYDFHCPLMSLPLIFGTTPGTVPLAAGYLDADPERAAAWRARLGGQCAGAAVGLVWAGAARLHRSAFAAVDRRRSIRLAQFAPLASAGVTFVSLQKGPPSGQATRPPDGMRVLDFTRELRDFDDTASLVAALDLVISVDTSVAHLAGALGVPVWIINRSDACWRWLLGRSDSPWYESATLFRQPEAGDWNSVLRDVGDALSGLYGQA